MKNILVLVHDDAGQEARLQAALDLARALGGHLRCVDVAILPVAAGEFDAGIAEAALIEDERAREAENRMRIEVRLAREDVPWDWIDVIGDLAASVEKAAASADIVVLNRKLDSIPAPDMRGLVGEVLVGSDKVVVAVPEQARGFAAAGHAMIAWDGSAEAMKAVQTAMPLLGLAGTVTLVEIADGTIEVPAEEAAAYLSRHDVRPTVVRQRVASGSTADTLVREAGVERADYVLMGGFGHGRIGEAIFGGVSREMLTRSPVPLVMAH